MLQVNIYVTSNRKYSNCMLIITNITTVDKINENLIGMVHGPLCHFSKFILRTDFQFKSIHWHLFALICTFLNCLTLLIFHGEILNVLNIRGIKSIVFPSLKSINYRLAMNQ